MNRYADLVIRQFVAHGVARLPWQALRQAVRETALVVAYEQGRKVGRREGFDGAWREQERRQAVFVLETAVTEVEDPLRRPSERR